MRILFEEHQYEPQMLGDIVKDVTGVEQNIEDKKISLGYVGYFFSPAVNDCVFILPKVLLEGDGSQEVVAFVEKDGKPVYPEDIIHPEGQECCLTKEYRKFLYEFAVWVYRAIDMYRKTTDTKAVYHRFMPQEGRGRKHAANTFLDILLSLIRFNQENQNYFMFIVKNLHAGMNKINWTKTISKSQAIVQAGSPVYLNPVNKKRQINFDEELLIIFFSILNYINDQYGFRAPINCQYELITGNRFEAMIKGMGAKRLRAIKYKYFSDKDLQLWNLCFAFFDNTHKITTNTNQKEFLLAKSFEHVFEAMIDELIGTPHRNIPKGLADQDDGKRVDHLYPYQSLTSSEKNDEVYYIGDSKYYKNGHQLGRESVYKQYTYARNVIQWNINLFLNDQSNVTRGMSEAEISAFKEDKDKFNKIRLRKDDATEGYNIIPNFFLSAFVYKELKKDDNQGNIRLHNRGRNIDEHSTYITYQFENRLFDRDTLILSHYDVNFLFVLYLYARNKSGEKAAWRNKVREIFRDEIRLVLENKFDFYALKAHDVALGKKYIQDHFKELNGKIFTPYTEEGTYSLALNKEKTTTDDKCTILSELETFFYVTKDPVKLGEDPTEKLAEAVEKRGVVVHPQQYEGILIGMVRNGAQLQWVKETKMYNIRTDSRFFRSGSKQLTRSIMLVNKVVLYQMADGEVKFLGVFPVVNDSLPSKYNYEDMNKLLCPYPYDTEKYSQEEIEHFEYILFELEMECNLSMSDSEMARYRKLIEDNTSQPGAPIVI